MMPDPLLRKVFWLVLLSFIFSASVPAQAAFQDDGWGARPVGMGGAFTAIADDTSAPLYNPAGLSQVQWNEVSAMYARLFTGLTIYSGGDQTGGDTVHLDESYLAFVSKPNKLGSFALSWANFNTTHLYREDTFILSYAHYLDGLLPVPENTLSFGASVKYLHRSIALDAYTVSDPVFANGTTKSAASVDAGLLYKPEDGALAGWRLGFSALNLNRPDVGFGAVDRVPTEYRVGVAYQSRLRPWIVPDVDYVRRNGVSEVDGGCESWLFHDTIGLRAGAGRDSASAGLSYYQTFNKKLGFRLDYGFTIPFYIQGTDGSQRLQASFYF
jgi:hypothetical protein